MDEIFPLTNNAADGSGRAGGLGGQVGEDEEGGVGMGFEWVDVNEEGDVGEWSSGLTRLANSWSQEWAGRDDRSTMVCHEPQPANTSL